jgi:hypothetical protein
MKTIKSLFAASLIVAAFSAATVFAVTPHWIDAPQTVQGSDSVDYAHAQTALGNAGMSKSARPAAVATSAQADPNLIACKKMGKATCPKCGAIVPCCKTVTACCN